MSPVADTLDLDHLLTVPKLNRMQEIWTKLWHHAIGTAAMSSVEITVRPEITVILRSATQCPSTAYSTVSNA